MEDAQIVELYWQRDEAALAETEAKYGNYCLAIANGVLHDAQDAQECVNDTFLGAWNAIPPHRPEILSTFLGKVTARKTSTSSQAPWPTPYRRYSGALPRGKSSLAHTPTP